MPNQIPTGTDAGRTVHALRFAYYLPGGRPVYRPMCEAVASGNAVETGDAVTCRKCLSKFTRPPSPRKPEG